MTKLHHTFKHHSKKAADAKAKATEAEMKDRLEVEMQRRACVAYRTLTPEDAAKVLADEQREVAADWPSAYRRYMAP